MSINVISPFFFALLASVLALVTAYILDKIAPLNLSRFRYSSIDGLRGYLAFFVFLHHSYIWFEYIHTHEWTFPSSNFYRYLGSGSVMVFFMITSFLFFGRLLDAKKNRAPINWLHLYASRIMRISPLFLLATTVAFVIAGYASNWAFNADLKEALWRILLTLGMGLFAAPILDSFSPTGLGGPVMAFALWTLPYEWIFYMMLPAFAILLKIKLSKYILIIPVIAIFCLLDLKLARIPAHSFLSGMLVAILVRTHFVKYLQGFPSAFISTCLIVFSILKFSDPFSFYPLIILSFFFSVVASGNSFFGILSLRVSRVMGEISFGIYLLHGILLFTLLRLFLGDSQSIALHQYEYWGYILFCTPILIIICYLTFRIIEKPCMNLTMGVEKKITSLFYR